MCRFWFSLCGSVGVGLIFLWLNKAVFLLCLFLLEMFGLFQHGVVKDRWHCCFCCPFHWTLVPDIFHGSKCILADLEVEIILPSELDFV